MFCTSLSTAMSDVNTVVAWYCAGRKLFDHSAGPTTILFDGRSTTYPGRFSFSLPSPYTSHDPSDGRIGCKFPVCIWISAGSWFGTSVFIDRITQQSSITRARCGSVSLTSIPLCPHLLNFSGDGMNPLPFDFL